MTPNPQLQSPYSNPALNRTRFMATPQAWALPGGCCSGAGAANLFSSLGISAALGIALLELVGAGLQSLAELNQLLALNPVEQHSGSEPAGGAGLAFSH